MSLKCDCVCRSGGEADQIPGKRQRVLRSSQNVDRGIPELPKREGLLGNGAQGSDSEEDPVEMLGKRKRARVDYRKLNAEMFGEGENIDGEGTEDEDFSPRADARAAKDAS